MIYAIYLWLILAILNHFWLKKYGGYEHMNKHAEPYAGTLWMGIALVVLIVFAPIVFIMITANFYVQVGIHLAKPMFLSKRGKRLLKRIKSIN